MASGDYNMYGNSSAIWTTDPLNIYTDPLGNIYKATGGSSPANTVYTNATTVATINFTPIPSPCHPDNVYFENLIDKMTTVARDGEKLVVCVDLELTDEQVQTVADRLSEAGVAATVIRGARAGYGFPGKKGALKPEEERVDILARLGSLWQRYPNLKLTELLAFWDGTVMDDETFAAAAEVHFKKAMNWNSKQVNP